MGDRIGVAVTTRNRRDVFERTLSEIRRLLPAGARLVVVDDASDEPVPEADYRFEANAGVARAKNKCLELLQGCDHLFLFDDDIFPVVPDWHLRYIESAEPHLMYIYPDRNPAFSGRGGPVIYDDGSIRAYVHPRGSMLYFERRCLDTVGGFDPSFGGYGFEHPNLSERIHAAGLTSFKFADVVDSHQLFHCLDEVKAVDSSVPRPDREQSIAAGRARFDALRGKAYFFPYAGRNVVITAYFTGKADPQRGDQWASDLSALDTIANSIAEVSPGTRLVVLNDCFEETHRGHVDFLRCRLGMSPYLQRWLSIQRYLQAHPDIERAWCVDATDVEMLHDPFPVMGWKMYCGSEPEVVGCRWMKAQHGGPEMNGFLHKFASRTLINTGLLGGPRADLLEFIGEMLSAYERMEHKRFYQGAASYGVLDMGLFNLVGFTKFPGRLHFGHRVHTRFKAFERTSAWWRHK